jgi:hypothetical protein
MQSAQFIKGMIDGIEVCYESLDVLQVLPANKLSELWDLEKIGTYSRVYLSERVVAKTSISKAAPDNLGRDGIINHTVLYRFDSTIEHDGLNYVFPEDQFAKDARAGKFNFKMPPFPELKHPLDYPPKMEVQI